MRTSPPGSIAPSARARRLRALGRPGVASAVALVIGVAASLLAARHEAHHNAEVAEARFARVVAETVDRVRGRFATYEYGLRGARGVALTVGLDRLTRGQFAVYARSREVDVEFPGARGFGLIKRVPVAGEAAFVARAEQDEWPGFTVRQLEPHAAERYVIQYIEPVSKNRAAVGLDIGSEATRRSAADAALTSGEATLTGPITLVQALGQPLRSFLLLLPIYEPGRPLTDEAARRAAGVGWTYAPLVADEVLAGLDVRHAHLHLRDVADVGAQPFYGSGPEPSLDPTLPRLTQRLVLFGRTWEAEVVATPAFVSELRLWSPTAVAGLGLVLSLLVAALVYVGARARHEARQVRAEQQRRATMVQTSADAIVGLTLRGRITDWNPGARRLFGFTAGEAVGQHVDTLLAPDVASPADDVVSRMLSRAQPFEQLETARRRRDGTSLEVSVSASCLVDAAGAPQGTTLILRDVSASRRAERRLAELNATLEAQVRQRTALLEAARRDLEVVIDAVPAMIGYWDRELRCRVANRALAESFGLAREALVGRTWPAHGASALSSELRVRVEAALRGEPQAFEQTLPRRDGAGTRAMLVRYEPDRGPDGVRGFYVLAQDISELTESRAQLAAALRENQALLGTITAHSIVSIADAAGRIVEVNDNFCRAAGYTSAELVGHTHAVVSSKTHDPGFWADVWATISAGRSWRGDICNRAKDGSVYWIDSVLTPFVDASGQVVRYISMSNDITARKRADAALRQTTSLLGSVLDSASEVSIIATDQALKITVFNVGAERLLGYAADEVVGRATPMILHDADEVTARAAQRSTELGRTVVGGEVFVEAGGLGRPAEWIYIRKDGTRVTVSLIVTAMHGPSGEILGYLGVAHDVTRQKAAEHALREAAFRAKQASEAKSQFLANMSHEIRTPMNAVIGLADLLGDTPLSDEQASLLAKVRVASRSLLSVINDVLDLSKIEANELNIEHTPLSLRRVVDELHEVMASAAEAKGVALRVVTPEVLPTVSGDPTRLTQVLTNLVSNAIKFSPHGSVTLRLEELPAPPDRHKLRYSVRDTGIGMSPEAVAKLFAPFQQADTSTTRRFGGTGLGLSIVKRLVELMGGEVGVSSELGAGTEFWVLLELPRAAALETRVSLGPRGRRLSGVRVLLTDDSDINLEVGRRILEREGAEVCLAHDGREAVERLRARADIDLVLLDVQMPVLDGYAATRLIRTELGLTQLPIIALTASALSTEQARAREAGMDDFLSKPFDADVLVRRMRRHLFAEAHAPASAGVPAAVVQGAAAGGWPRVDGIDAADVSQRLGGDVELFVLLLGVFLGEFGGVAELVVDPEQLVLLGARAHKLAGSAVTLGATRLHARARLVEDACRAGNAAVARAQLAEVAGELALLTAAHGRLAAATQSAVTEAQHVPRGPPRARPSLSP
jgi:nitrogen fixation negative regulator NifL